VLSASLIVPTFNRPVALARTLDALRAMRFPASNVEIFVVDSGSEQAGAGAVASMRGARYVPYSNAGVAAARNAGARLATSDLLLFVDDDIVVGADNLSRHEAIHEEDGWCLVSGRWEFDAQLRARLRETPLGRFRLRYEDLYNTPPGVKGGEGNGRVHPLTLAAANLSVRRELFWELGGFDERFPVAAEDQDLSWRARQAGCVLIYDYDIRVIHNDQHADLAALCERVERAAIGTVFFASKHPEAPPADLVNLNGPTRRGDPPKVILRKVLRGTLSRGLALHLAHRVVRWVEPLRPNGGWPLEQLYNALTGLHVFRGTRRGLEMTRRHAPASATSPREPTLARANGR
jgi:GT2 family glycosyltransferase